ncbi:hypothetical protein PSTG_02467 [Puccinia striiformis f. sp. tritici PST-78]|uniref:No apical meristem-associated C-terminal domain-containing protein n=1 Tax=Puccinia striiformis f. sp. tritici PST-78 TaxID=1165861 RepID=A0A0L0VZD3_9BASI|nr:hypothetical protein PSTG_02467 [Puccinia striiformis f. sp. tritici PST-78]
MPSTTDLDPTSSPTQRTTTKKRSRKAVGAQPVEVDIDDGEPADEPAKKPRKTNKKKSQAVVTPKINEQVNENDGESEVVKENSGSRSKTTTPKKMCRYATLGLRRPKTLSTPPINPARLSGLAFTGITPNTYLNILGLLTAKFHGCVKQIILAKQSGKTLADRLPAALKLYAGLSKGKSYTHIHCYHILLVAQKWLDYCEQLEQKRLADLKKIDQSSDVPQSDLASDTTAVATNQSEETGRPPGNKKAKDSRAQELKDSKWKDDLVKVNRDLANHSQSQAAILAEQKDALVAMSDEATMLIDLNNIPDAKREFFEWRQQKVMEKMMKAKAEEARNKKEAEEKKKKEDEEKEEEKKRKEEEEEKRKKDEDDKKKKLDKENRKKKGVQASKVTQKKTTTVKKKSVSSGTGKTTKAAAAAEAKRRAVEVKKRNLRVEVEVEDEHEEEEEEEGDEEDEEDEEKEEEEEVEVEVEGGGNIDIEI